MATWDGQSVNSTTWETLSDQGGLNLYDESDIAYDSAVIEYNGLGTVTWSDLTASSAPSWGLITQN